MCVNIYTKISYWDKLSAYKNLDINIQVIFGFNYSKSTFYFLYNKNTNIVNLLFIKKGFGNKRQHILHMII